MKYFILFVSCMTHAMYRESMPATQASQYVHVETVTRVLRENTNFIDADNSSLVADSHSVVEVTLKIHRPNRPVKTIKLNVDI